MTAQEARYLTHALRAWASRLRTTPTSIDRVIAELDRTAHAIERDRTITPFSADAVATEETLES